MVTNNPMAKKSFKDWTHKLDFFSSFYVTSAVFLKGLISHIGKQPSSAVSLAYRNFAFPLSALPLTLWIHNYDIKNLLFCIYCIYIQLWYKNICGKILIVIAMLLYNLAHFKCIYFVLNKFLQNFFDISQPSLKNHNNTVVIA